jgi:hypothetical protein
MRVSAAIRSLTFRLQEKTDEPVRGLELSRLANTPVVWRRNLLPVATASTRTTYSDMSSFIWGGLKTQKRMNSWDENTSNACGRALKGTQVLGLNPARGMGVYPRFPV